MHQKYGPSSPVYYYVEGLFCPLHRGLTSGEGFPWHAAKKEGSNMK